MPTFSQTSEQFLQTCHPVLQLLMREVVRGFDCKILEGFRDAETQERYYREGKSQVTYPHSQHNCDPAEAVDVLPHPFTRADWEDWRHFDHLAGFVKGVFQVLQDEGQIAEGWNLIWGGDWDDDNALHDNRFNDLVHWELVWRS